MRAIARQRGVALIIALLVVALATIIVAGLLDRGELAAARTRNQLRNEQVEAFQLGLEAYAARVLVRDREDGRVDANGDIWSLPLPPTPVPGGTLSATMRDQDGCFNLNNLLPTVADAPRWRTRFETLLKVLELDPAIAAATVDWVDADRDPVDNGAEDNVYLSNTPAYRAADRPFVHVSELRLVRGVGAEAYAKLAPYVCAVPAGSKLNVNTAPIPVLRSLSRDITDAIAQRLWRNGQAHWTTTTQFQTELVTAGIRMENSELLTLDVQSKYFLASGDIELDGLSFATSSLIVRDDGGVRVVQRGRAEH